MTGCVAFDLDDTLYLERDYVRSGFRAVSEFLASREGIDGAFTELWRGFESGVRGKSFDLLLEKRGVPAPRTKRLVPELVRIYRSHRPDIMLAPDVLGTLSSLRAAGFTLGLISDGEAEVQRRKLAALGLEGGFDHLVLTDELGRNFGKPHPAAFKKIEKLSGFSGSRCVCFADNPAKDFIAPRSMGWYCVRIRRPNGLHFDEEPPADGSPHEELESLVGAGVLIMNLLKGA